jgi:phospholipid/cholesterol/gamma-HCH transport system substrate-binding protein
MRFRTPAARFRTPAIRPRTPIARLRLVASAAAALTGVGLLSGCSFNGVGSLPLPGGPSLGSHPYSVKVEFSNVLDLVPQSTCKLNDVSVGKVTNVKLSHWHAVVTCKIRQSAHLPSNAIATIGQTSLLGEKYVALSPPTQEPSSPTPLVNGMTIPLSRTTQGTDIEEVLSALSMLLNGGGIEQVATITHELNSALHGREDTIKDVLGRINTFVGTLDTQKSQIVRALDSVNTLIGKLNDQKQVIADTIDKTGPAIAILRQNRADLTTMLTSLARFSTVSTNVIGQTQSNLLGNLRALQPILTNLNKAGSDVPNGLEGLLSYPFPPTYSNVQKGDYANIHITLDLTANDLLHNLLGGTSLDKSLSKAGQQLRDKLQPPQITIPAGPPGVLPPGQSLGQTGGNGNLPLGEPDPALRQLLTGGLQ